MPYSESVDASSCERKRLVEEVNTLITEARKSADTKRQRFFVPDTSSAPAYENSLEKYRARLVELLGWPLTEKSAGKIEASVIAVAEDEWGRIFRVHVPAIDPVHAYGLLFLPPRKGTYPLVLAQHGGLGAPELASGLTPRGTCNYNQFIQGLRRQSVAVFAPQLLVWHGGQEPQIDQYQIDRNLRQLGGSRAALDLSMLRRALDWLETHPEIDPGRIGITGLSYGGFYSLFFSALDPRIRVTVCSCFANNRYLYNWEDWAWTGAANCFLDSEVAGLVCPRPLFLEVGKEDKVFNVSGFEESRITETLTQTYGKLGLGDRFRSRIHPGTHEYDPDGEAEKFLLKWL